MRPPPTFEDTLGWPWFHVGVVLPTYDFLPDNLGVEPMHLLENQLEFESGSRVINSVTLAMISRECDVSQEITIEERLTCRMKGIGCMNRTWPHGACKGALAMESECWKLAKVDELANESQHVQHLMKVRMGDHQGIGVLEQSNFGS